MRRGKGFSAPEIRKLIVGVNEKKMKAISIHQHGLTHAQIKLLREAGWFRIKDRIATPSYSWRGRLKKGYIWYSPDLKPKKK